MARVSRKIQLLGGKFNKIVISLYKRRFNTSIELKASKMSTKSGKSIKPPIQLCSRNMPRPMYPLTIQLCYFCQKGSSEKDCFITEYGKVYFSVQVCPNCLEYNKAMQEAGSEVLNRQMLERSQLMSGEKV